MFVKRECHEVSVYMARPLASIPSRKWANLFLEQSRTFGNLSIDGRSNPPFERIDKGQYRRVS